MVIEITKKKLFIFLSLLVVIIAIPLTVYLSQKQQETRSGAAPVVAEDAVIITINGEDITKGEIRAVAEEQYDPTAVDQQALKDALEVLEERKVLDIEAQIKGITPDSSEVQARMNKEGLSQTQAKYDVLRDSVTLLEVKSRQVLSIGIWSPAEADQVNLDAVDKETAKNQTRDGLAALPAIQTKITNGQDLLVIADSVISQYPSFADAIAVNGSKLTDLTAEEKNAVKNPMIVEFGDLSMDQTTLDTLFAMDVDSVKTISNTETNSAGIVFKVLQKGNDNGLPTYDQWLTEKKSSLVIPKLSL